MRILAIDFGEKRIGLALSDALGITAQGLPTLFRQNMKQVLLDLAGTVKAHEVGEIIVGLPINMDGSHGKKAEEVHAFIPKLAHAAGVPVSAWDERLTSREASRFMIEADVSRKKQKEQSDRLAATLILQNYLEFKRSHSRS